MTLAVAAGQIPSAFNVDHYSAVVGSMMVATSEILFAGKALLRMFADHGFVGRAIDQ
jgi:hypothetical protein